GVLGEVHPRVVEAFDLPAPWIASAELDLEALLEKTLLDVYRLLPRYPAVVEDIAFLVDEEIPAARVEELIRQAGGELLEEVGLFDLYRGEPIPPGQKSLAYMLTYRASDRTLTDQAVAGVRQAIVDRLRRDLKATLRA
ncbi:MAG: phenylalanine--tRNA ligase subunit beta, partial [Chloroflexi bacterium]|nr:phenylalanine--tRNA ligase subunit beta [Chloroflexota bacterium]